MTVAATSRAPKMLPDKLQPMAMTQPQATSTASKMQSINQQASSTIPMVS